MRIDIYERLAALVRNEAKKTKFKITEEMLSIAGSTKDNLKNFITETLKYQFLKKDTSDDEEYYFKKTNNNKFKNTRKSKIKNKVSKFDLNKNSPFYILKSLKS